MNIAEDAHFLVRHGITILQTFKRCFLVQTITLNRCTLFMTVPCSSTVNNCDSQYSWICDMADNAHFLVRHGNRFLQTSKGCFPVQTITLDRFTLLLAVLSSFTVDNLDIQSFRISRYVTVYA